MQLDHMVVRVKIPQRVSSVRLEARNNLEDLHFAGVFLGSFSRLLSIKAVLIEMTQLKFYFLNLINPNSPHFHVICICDVTFGV